MNDKPRVALRELPSPRPESPHYDAVPGTLVAANVHESWVEFVRPDGSVAREQAVTTVAVDEGLLGHPVMLMFLGGDLAQPVIIGILQPGQASPKKTTRTKKLVLEGREVVIGADSELTLRCGKSSITLTKTGKIVLRGTHLVSRASSVNRIRGGVIQLN
ncbi:DUF6484 domain-containing protein [Nannocystaceae bacterium ST9]